MTTIGVRQLKQRISDVLRRVRERGEEVEVTLRGKVIARLVPVGRARLAERKGHAVWRDIDRLAHEIGARWPKGVSAERAVREARRG